MDEEQFEKILEALRKNPWYWRLKREFEEMSPERRQVLFDSLKEQFSSSDEQSD